MPLILAGLLRLPFGTLLHHSSVFIGLSPMINVVSFSLTRFVSVPPFGMHIVLHSAALLSSVLRLALLIIVDKIR